MLKFIKTLFKKPQSYLVICPNKAWAENLFERLKKYCEDTKRTCISGGWTTCMHCGSDEVGSMVEFISIHDADYIDTQANHKGKTVSYEEANGFLCRYEESVAEFQFNKEEKTNESNS